MRIENVVITFDGRETKDVVEIKQFDQAGVVVAVEQLQMERVRRAVRLVGPQVLVEEQRRAIAEQFGTEIVAIENAHGDRRAGVQTAVVSGHDSKVIDRLPFVIET